MPFCRNCGTEVKENDLFCHACGASQGVTDPHYTDETPAVGKRRAWLFIYSVLNLLFLLLPLGIIALIYTLRAEKAETLAEERRRAKIALRINIISTAAIAFVVILYLLFTVHLPLYFA